MQTGPLSKISGIKTRIEAKPVPGDPPSGLEIIDVCENGQIEMLKVFIECGADIDRCEWAGPEVGNMCRVCIADEKVKHYYGYSPLVIACYSKQIEVVKLLLTRKCALDVSYKANRPTGNDEDREYDALHAACRSKSNKEIIDMLMDEKGDWNYDHLTKELDCNKDMIAYVKSKRPNQVE